MSRSSSMNGGIIGADNTPSPSKKITTFTSNGCFNRTATTATVIVVAGGGGAERGGGGAGGVLITECHPLPSDAVPVTIGAGGGRADLPGTNASAGSNSVFGSATPLTATGGGFGGGTPASSPSAHKSGGDGGSGGGGGGCNPANDGDGVSGQGFDGGSSCSSAQGGGGGAVEQGGSGGNQSGFGGRGKDLTPYGVPTCIGECGFVGGGGAGSGDNHPSNPYQTPGQPGPRTPHSGAPQAAHKSVGEGGLGGGGMAQVGYPPPCQQPHGIATNGLANTGGGGGGANNPGSPPFPAPRGDTSKSGGSGIVIVIECVAGSSANSGIYGLQAQFRDTNRSSW